MSVVSKLIEEMTADADGFASLWGVPDSADITPFADKMMAANPTPAQAQWLEWLLRQGMLVGKDPDVFVAEMNLTGCLRGLWRKFGFPIFRLTDALAAALILTDTKDAKAEELHFPFPAFAVQLSGGYIPFVDGENRGWVKLITAYRYHYRGKEVLFVQASCPELKKQLWTRHPIERFNNAAIFDHTNSTTPIYAADPMFGPEDSVTLTAAVRLLFATVIWVSAKNALATAPREPWFVRNPVPGRQYPAVWRLDSTVRLTKALNEAARAAAVTPPGEWKLRFQSVTRGHHQRYHVGEGRTETVWRWKEPFIRGMNNELAARRVYEVT